MSRRDDDQPSSPADDEIGQDYEFEDALETEWREVYGDRPGPRSAPQPEPHSTPQPEPEAA